MKNMHILLFYKYVNITSPTRFRRELLNLCAKIDLKGRILIAKEGINGSVAGDKKQTEKFKAELRKDERFTGILFKEDIGTSVPFKKMIVKIKEELVKFEQDVDLKNTGKHITPKEFIDMYKKGEDMIVLDARNDYESEVGKFKGAVTPKIKTFREFPKVAKMLKGKEDKKIIMYCTGGIRCEKASAYLKERGFKDVTQLSGGILNFGKEFPDTVWEGKCFVFDKRLVSKVNNEDEPLTVCIACGVKCDLVKNCRNNFCDKLITLCLDCEKRLAGCCSEKCKQDYIKNGIRVPRGFRYLNK